MNNYCYYYGLDISINYCLLRFSKRAVNFSCFPNDSLSTLLTFRLCRYLQTSLPLQSCAITPQESLTINLPSILEILPPLLQDEYQALPLLNSMRISSQRYNLQTWLPLHLEQS